MAAPSLLSATELTLTFGTQKLLLGATLAVGAGEKVGLVGRNGCGKTSLIKLLSGANEADGGDISRRRGLRVGYLPQDFELDPTLTVERNIQAGAADVIEWMRRYEEGEGSDAELADIQHHIEDADGWHLDSRIKSLTTALSAPPLDALVGPLSGGEKRRVALCRALASQPDLLLLDEPTNHLDSESIRWLESFLREFKGAVIFITHDRYFLDVIATRIIELDAGRCFSHPGNYTSYLESKAVRQQIASQAERRRQRFLREELDWVRAGVRAQRSKSRGRLDAYYATADLAAPPEEREMDLLIPPATEIGNTAVTLDKAGAKVGEGSDARWLFRNLNLTLRPGQCTGIVGRNGSGKTTLVRLCLGERQPEEGTVTIGKKVVFNSIDQGRMQLREDSTVLAEVQDSDEVVYFGGQAISARGYLRRFLFPDERANERVSLLSGGERARLMLAKVLKRGGNVLVLDEPTNDLDLSSLRLLEEAIASFDGCVIVVSHDRYFLDRICDQIVGFEENGVFIQPGNFSYYEEKKRQRDQFARSPAPVAAPAPPPVITPAAPAPKARKLSYKEKQELDGMEAAILAAEQRVAELDALLADPEFFVTRAAEAPKFIAEAERKRAEIPKLYARWEELAAATGQ